MLGSIIPSSRYLVEELLGPVDWSSARYVVEYGPGVGTMTHEIRRRMRGDAQLLAIELNEAFARYLQADFADDERVTVVNASAADVDGLLAERDWPGFDCGFSGIPFSTMPARIRDEILEKTREYLLPGGEFAIFQFSNKVFPHLQRAFDRVEKGFVLRNILPAHCYRCSTAVSAQRQAGVG